MHKFFDEENRLFSKSGQVEKITTLNEISKFISQDSKILDVGAGTGVYSIPLADKVNEVVAFEPATNNYGQIIEIIKKNNLQNITVENKSSLDMEELKDEYFDIVLLFGPMYHLASEEDRIHTLSEAKRAVEAGGHILVSFINRDMIPMTEIIYNSDYFKTEGYNPKSKRLINSPFRTIYRAFAKLQEKGYLERIGSKKDGKWIVIK